MVGATSVAPVASFGASRELGPVSWSGTVEADVWWWVGALGAVAAASLWLLWWQRRTLARERDRLNQAQELERQRLAAEQARQAKEAADAANRAKGEFLATMSHEIRTPLNGVIGSAELMLETPLTAQQREYMATVRTSAEALLAIVNDILDFSKIEEGRLTIEQAVFDLRQPVADVVKIATARIEERDLELVLDVAADVPARVYGDASRVRQVLLNLVSNAIKFTPKGHVLVRVSRVPEKSGAGQAWIRFSVVDTGIGIPAETRVRLFEKFTQADASTTRRFGGTGLGLAISKRLVGLMGGEIGLESDPGHGSLFWFSLPLRIDELQPPQPTAPVQRVLVADDLPAAAEAIAGMLRGVGMTCAIAASADETLAKIHDAVAQEHPFEAVLVDESLARAQGGRLARELQALPDLQGVPLVLLAGSRPRPAEETATFAISLNKPVVHLDQLLEVLHTNRPDHADAEARSDAGVRLSRAGLQMLVAEDNPVNRAVIGSMLRKLGCTVEFAENGAEAVAKMRLGRFDLIFMDCLMPEMDGWTATLEIRRIDARTPIIATTANATNEDRSRCLKVGMNDYLSKPLRLTDVVRVIERWLG